jgi:hypothetical protein
MVGVVEPVNPMTAWSPSFAKTKDVVYSAHKAKTGKYRYGLRKGDCFTLYYDKLGRVGHVGFIVAETNDYYITIEGNTGTSGSRDGAGVHKLKRAKNKIYTISRYIDENKNYSTLHTTIISTYELLSQTYYVNLETAGQHGADDTHKRCGGIKGHGYTDSTRQFTHTTDSCSGQLWEYKYARNESGEYTQQTFRFDTQRQYGCRLYMQGAGTKGTITGTNHRGVEISTKSLYVRRNYYKHCNKEVHTQMG